MQKNFFDLVEKDPNTIQGSVYQLADGRWFATIAGGWWLAYAGTKEAAIKKVTNNYNSEVNYFWWSDNSEVVPPNTRCKRPGFAGVP